VERLEAVDELCQRLRRDLACHLLKEKDQPGAMDARSVLPQVLP
jgi:hypothetical protein